jgi:hypothetical protein
LKVKNVTKLKKMRINVLVAKYFVEIPDIIKNIKNIVVDHKYNNNIFFFTINFIIKYNIITIIQ